MVVADGGGMEATSLQTCIIYLWLKGLLKIISVIICFGDVYGEPNFHCLCFYKFLPYCSFCFLSSSEAVLLELSEL